jgi:acetyl-CoA carboxylase biotin carboxyl carrier protein
MPLDEKEVFEVLALFEKSDWEEIHLESGEFKLTVSKRGRPQASATTSAARTRSTTSDAPTAAAAAASAAKPAPPAEPVDPSWVGVRSPTLGTFYVAPKPGAPPFVTVGQKIGEDDTVAIVEVMKLMNQVKAGVAGIVARIAAANGELVEFEQVLVWIDPGPA